jgi:tetratricopeptide (TPR) repeat protein
MKLALAMVLFAAAPAAAQDARAEFTMGAEAAEARRFADALGHFRRSYELSHNPVALYNEATTLRALGRYVEARATLERFLRDHFDAATDLRESVTTMLDDVTLRIARLTIRAPELPSLELRIDGEVRAIQVDPFDLDPGHHVVQAIAPEHRPFSTALDLSIGERRTLDLVLPRESTEGGDAWIWGPIAGLAAAVVIAVAISIGVAVTDASQLSARTGVVLRP